MNPHKFHISPSGQRQHFLICCVFLQEELMSNTELVQSYRQQINNTVNQFNLQLFWNMYNRCQI